MKKLKNVIQQNFDCAIFGAESEEILKIAEHMDYLLQYSPVNKKINKILPKYFA